MIRLLFVPLACALVSSTRAQERPQPDMGAFLGQHCIKCHGAENPEGGLNLIALAQEGFTKNKEEWLLVAEELSLGVMPPHPEAKPSREATINALDILREAFGNEVPSIWNPPVLPTFSGLRRRTAREIAGSILDLTGTQTKPGELPAEIGFHTYDVVGAGMALDEVWLDRWLSYVDSVSRRAVHPKNPPPVTPRVATASGLKSTVGNGGRLNTVGTAYIGHDFPRDGEYELSVTAWAQQAGPDLARVALVLGQKRLKEDDIPGEGPRAPITIKKRIRVAKGKHRVGLSFLNDYYDPEAPIRGDQDRNVIVTRVSVKGPLDVLPPTPLQEELLQGINWEKAEDLRPALALFAQKAWQESPEEADISRLIEMARMESSLESQLQLGIAAILASPRFLLVGEVGEPGEKFSDPALADRLGLFLWGSVPDARLKELAADGSLAEFGVLDAEVDRMLLDPRSSRLGEGFVPQWLQILRLATHEPSKELFPKYDEDLLKAMLAEPVRLFQTILDEDLPARDLVRADWTHINKRLAKHYGLRTVGMPKDTARYSLKETPRRGVLGQAAVLTASSDPARTSPVLRGKWILEALLGDAPPPPDANNMALDQSAPTELGLSIRERLKLHRNKPGCATCHVAMDPLGFALERFNAVGKIRIGDVDDQGTLPDGTHLDGPLGLTQVLETDTRFLPHLVRSLATYALSRPPSDAELSVLYESMGDFDEEEPTLRFLVRTIALSDMFRHQPANAQGDHR